MNIVQVEYRILKAFENELHAVDSVINDNRTVFTWQIENNQRVYIRTEVKEMVFCTDCGDEIINPSYAQTTCRYPKTCTNKKDEDEIDLSD